MPSFENVLPSGADTLLTISGLEGMLYQARGLTQTLEHIPQAKHVARTVNGTLIDMSAEQFRKFLSKITCTDVNAPPIDNLWEGMDVTVHCAASLAYKVGNVGSPSRSVVSGSDYTEGHMTFYRPILDMRIVNISTHFDEWKAANQWEIDLEEI